MTINSVRTIEFDNDGSKLTVDATTWLPATPTLLIFCCGYRLLPKKVKRGGKEVPHGNLLYLDCTPSMFDPVATGGTEFHWEVANEDYVPGCKDCHLAIVELAEQPKVDWTTQVYECPPVPVGGVFVPEGAYWVNAAVAAADAPALTFSVWFNAVGDSDGGIWCVLNLPNPIDAFAAYQQNYELDGWTTIIPSQATADGDTGSPQYGMRLWFDWSGIAAGVWHNLLISLRTDGDYVQAYLDDMPVAVTIEQQDVGFDVHVAGESFFVGVSADSGQATWHGSLAELWWNLGTNLDLADETVRRLFISAEGTPVDLGANGEVPTGLPPTIYGHGGAASFLLPNLGTAGSFTLIGAVTNAPTSPKVGEP